MPPRRGGGRGSAAGRRTLAEPCRVGPVVELLLAAAWREAPHVWALCIGALEVFVREVAVFVHSSPLGDAEVDKGLVPDVGEALGARNGTRCQTATWFKPGCSHGSTTPHGRSPFLDRDAIVPAVPIEISQAVFRRGRGWRKYGQTLRGPVRTAARHEPAHASTEKRRQLVRGDTVARRSGVDLDERRDRQPRGRGLGVEGMAGSQLAFTVRAFRL